MEVNFLFFCKLKSIPLANIYVHSGEFGHVFGSICAFDFVNLWIISCEFILVNLCIYFGELVYSCGWVWVCSLLNLYVRSLWWTFLCWQSWVHLSYIGYLCFIFSKIILIHPLMDLVSLIYLLFNFKIWRSIFYFFVN